MSIGAVVLAAGEASRFGSPKQRLLLPDVLGALEEAPVGEIVVVEGAHPLAASVHSTRGQARVVCCGDWASGPGASLRCGLRALAPEAEAAVVVLADGPDLSPAAVARVLERWRATGDGVVAASYEGERGHPLVVDRRAWAGIPDEGLRALPATLVPCDDLGPPGDVDTPADLPERLR